MFSAAAQLGHSPEGTDRLMNADRKRGWAALAAAAVLLALMVPVASAQAVTCFGAAPTILGTPGDDQIVGTEGDDVIVGLGGVDFIESLGGNDKVCGGDDPDVITPGAGDDEVDGEAGRDGVTFYDSPARVEVDAASGTAEGHGTDTITALEVIEGSEFNDTLRGSDGGDCLIGLGGNDRLEGRGGPFDFLFGDTPSFDLVIQQGCFTELNAFARRSLRNRSPTADGDDTMIGGSGADIFFGFGGNDRMTGGGGECLPGIECLDSVNYSTAPGPVRVDLQEETATGEGRDTVAGMETIDGSPFDDVLRGNDASNFIFGGEGNDTLAGRGGPDRFDGGPGTNGIDGGSHKGGFDYMAYSFQAGPATVDLSRGIGQGEGTDRFDGIEAVWGTEGDDVITGDDKANILNGEGGNDIVGGRGGIDLMSAGTGDDAVDGGNGSDIVAFDAAAGVVVDLSLGTAIGEGTDTLANLEGVIGSPSNDTIIGSDVDEILWAFGGDDTIDGAGGVDFTVYNLAPSSVNVNLQTGTATGGDGNDALANVEGIVGSFFDDVLVGNDENNSFDGQAGNDQISGAGGDDYFFGGPGNDAIDGGDGNFDVVDYFYTVGPVKANLAKQQATGEGRDDYSSIEGVVGSDGNDKLTGSRRGDYIAGDDGKDRVIGGGGNDRLIGDKGRDFLDGEAGKDDCFSGETNRSCEKFGKPEPPPLQDESRRARHRRGRHR
jgi:Ca2+-binding RTX toxin-like protein